MENETCVNCGMINKNTFKYCANCGFELPKVKAAIINETIQPEVIKKSKLSLKSKIGMVLGFGLFFAIQQFYFKTPSYDKVMMDVASELNKTCPIMVDRETRFDNAIALPDNIFQYNYTLVNVEKVTVKPKEIKQHLEPNLVNFVKTSPQMKTQRDFKTTLNYNYKDKNGEYLFLITITPDKYE